MKQIIRLTESELNNIVKKSVIRAINEGVIDEGRFKDMFKKGAKKAGKVAKKVGKAVGGAAAGTAALYTIGALHDEANKGNTNKDQQTINRQIEKGLGKDVLKPKSQQKKNDDNSIPKQKDIEDEKTRSWTGEARINRAVMESIRRYKRNRL